MDISNEKICIVLFGETGHGKSTLGNAIIGEEVFKCNDTMQSVTKDVYGEYGKGKSKNIFVIDTPGINDSQGKDNEYLKNISIYLKKRNDIKGIIIVLNYSLNNIYQNSAEKSFKFIFRIFNSINICYHIAIVFTHFYEGRRTPNRNSQGKKKELIFNIFKEKFKEMFGSKKCPIKSLPFYFLDIESLDDLDTDSQMEIDNMITTFYSRNPINSSIIQIKNDYNVKDEITSSRKVEEIYYDGDFIIKKIKTFRKSVLKFYDTSLNDSISEDLVDEKTERSLNESLILERKNLELKRKMEEEMKIKIQKDLEEQKRIRRKNEEELKKLREERKNKELKMKKLEEERKKIRKEREEKARREAEERIRKKKLEEEKLQKKKQEELKIKRERIRVCNQIKEFANSSFYENDSSTVYKLNQTWDYGYLSTPSYYPEEIKIELIKSEKIDLDDKPFQTVTGKINGSFSGKIIFGWKLINRHDNPNGGKWKRENKVLGTSNYNFTFNSEFWRGLHWTLELYGITIPDDYYENKDLKVSDYYYY